MINLEQIICIIVISFTFSIIPVFADNPTPYDEWDFNIDFSEVDVFQDSDDLRELVIKPKVSFEGEMALGTVNISANIINPDGKDYTLFGTLRDMKSGETGTVRLVHDIVQEGTYTINLKMTPPSEPYLDHVFDEQTITYEVPKYGFEKSVKVVGSEDDEMVTYQIEYPFSVQPTEAIHAVITLPEVHTFEKITVTNGDFAKDFDINTKDIYLESRQGYSDLKVNLIKENFIFPTADAQNTLQDYVTFYKVNKDMCSSLSCVAIDNEKIFVDYSYLWVLGFLSVIPVVYFMYKNRTKPYVSNLSKSGDKRKINDSEWGTTYVEPKNAI